MHFPFNGMLLLVYSQLLILHFTQDLKPHRLATLAQVLKTGFSPSLIWRCDTQDCLYLYLDGWSAHQRCIMALLACKSFLSIDFAYFNTFFFSLLLSTKLRIRGLSQICCFQTGTRRWRSYHWYSIIYYSDQISLFFLVVAGFLVNLASALLFYGWRCFVTWLPHHWLVLYAGWEMMWVFGLCVLLNQSLYSLLSAASGQVSAK